jgi:hypothetical protein
MINRINKSQESLKGRLITAAAAVIGGVLLAMLLSLL